MWGDGQVMIEDIKMVGQLGVQGVAIGVLTEDNKINVEQVLKKNIPPAAGLKI
jgi:copper homeostasis protein CutC